MLKNIMIYLLDKCRSICMQLGTCFSDNILCTIEKKRNLGQSYYTNYSQSKSSFEAS